MVDLRGLNSPKIIVEPPGPKVRELLKRAGLPPAQYFQPIMEEAGGIFIKYPDGNIFIDFISGRCVTSTDYSHPKVMKALQRQVAKGLHGITEARLELNTMLSEKTPGGFQKRVYYGQSDHYGRGDLGWILDSKEVRAGISQDGHTYRIIFLLPVRSFHDRHRYQGRYIGRFPPVPRLHPWRSGWRQVLGDPEPEDEYTHEWGSTGRVM